MDERVKLALERDRTIDITTTGRKTGTPRRIEIWFHKLEDHIYITGTPGRRDWYANLLENPEFTFHMKGGTRADLPASAVPITDKDSRRRILSALLQRMRGAWRLDAWVAGSPLVEVFLKD